MKGKVIVMIITLVGWVFFHFFNVNMLYLRTQDISKLEKALQAQKNIHSELLIEHDDLVSGRSVSSVVPEELSKYKPREEAGNVVYIQEPGLQQKTPTPYCIIDLFTPKAEAATTIIPD